MKQSFIVLLAFGFFSLSACAQNQSKNTADATGTYPVTKTDAEWKKVLTPEQSNILREKGTERPFTGEYYKTKAPGIYKCVACGNELFDADTKFDSGTGWPSFTQPLEPENIATHTDRKLFMTRTEARSKHGDSHLGHVFDDGPPPTGLRYCINGVVLDFEKAKQAEENYNRQQQAT
jgi:peptide-methionine (R)-S-oxide reductase